MDNLRDIAALAEAQAGYIKHQMGSDVYHIKLLPSIVAWDLAEDIAEFILPIIGSIADGEDGFAEDQWLNVGLIISKNLKDLKIAERAAQLLQGATKNGKQIDLTNDFLGAKGLVVLTELTEVALKENVLDFLLEWLNKRGLEIHSLTNLKKVQDQILDKSND